MTRTVKASTKRSETSYDIRIEWDGLQRFAQISRKSLGSGVKKVAIISNKKVFGLYGDFLTRDPGIRCFVHLVGDGERFKNINTLKRIIEFLSRNGFSRTDAVVALGGGVIGDVAGFAASVYLRGIQYIQIPTTLLAMIDSSVGGKTGINTDFGKNLVGAFYQPEAVLIDPSVLTTLPKRELTSGLCEAVKQGALSSPKLLDQTSSIIDLLTKSPLFDESDRKLPEVFNDFLAGQIGFKAQIVAGDERESSGKNDARSRKILNFGHTFAHALEKVSNYKYLKHGEAVGHGMIFAATLSKKLGILDENVVNLLRGVVHRTGNLPSITHFDHTAVFESFRFDKKNVGDSLQWVLLKGIGKPVIVPHDQIGTQLVRQTVKEIISA